MTLPMPIKCVGPWAGGKRRGANRIVELLGPHDIYIEPFVGGCSILPAKPRTATEIVNDKNPAAANVLGVMVRYPCSLIKAIEKVPFDRDVFHHARGYCDRAVASKTKAGYDVGWAAHQLVVWWQGPGGIAGTNRKPWFAQRHTQTGGCPKKRWESFKLSLPALCVRMKGVSVDCYCWSVPLMLGINADTADTAIYVDPPYLAKSFKYAVDFTEADHQELAGELNKRLRSRVVVSYRDDHADPDRLATLYPPSRWRRIEVEQSKNMSATQGKTTRNVEVLLVNDA